MTRRDRNSRFLRLFLFLVVGAALGAALGGLNFCTSGSCPLTATPLRGMALGGLIGLLLSVPPSS